MFPFSTARRAQRVLHLCCILAFLISAKGLIAQEQLPRVSVERAARHLIKSVEPTYPPFALAAGLEGRVRVEVNIDPQGRVGLATPVSGPFPLRVAAQAAVFQYVYAPFEVDGKPVSVQTVVEIEFRLPSPADRKTSFIPPKLKLSDFNFMSSSEPVKEIPPPLQKMLGDDLKSSERLAGCTPTTTENQDRIVRVDLQNSDIQLFLVARREPFLCDDTGNCPLEIIEEKSGDFRMAQEVMYREVSIVHTSDSPFPEIFIAAQASAGVTSVVVLARIGGEWGPIYCGSIRIDKAGKEVDDIQFCK